ncbi:MAG: SGNH/GDSL hydrolase family protein [Lachnospiraceae bacterium]|nr:SGNH/GDSL hydrolase family protein [Lachnospiraceae bacterium]
MGPIAPKDPVKKRDFFYIMSEKQISAAPGPDGKGVCFIYEDGGRMLSAAKIIGGMTDEAEIDMLKNTADFKKLVFGIGVSVMCGETDTCDFCFQMYGKSDPYGSGTTIRQTVSTDGVEYLIPLSEVKWSDDDNVPGQIRFEFPKSGMLATVNVRFYLNDGYTAPNLEEKEAVDLNCDEYRRMLDASVVSAGNPDRLRRAVEKAKTGEPVTVAFIGGSITQGAGATPINMMCYARKMFEAFTKKYNCEAKAEYIKAGVGGTPSELGMLRYRRDVLQNDTAEPDIVVIEFAVNDAGDETEGECYEALIRKAMNGPGHPAVLLIFSVFADDYNLEERCIPIGERYHLPMTSVKRCVTPQFYKTPDEGRIISKARFFYDCYHPTNLGHQVMADCLMKLIEASLSVKSSNSGTGTQADAAPAGSGEDSEGEAFKSADFEHVELLDRTSWRAKSFDDLKEETARGGSSIAEQIKQQLSTDGNDRSASTGEFPVKSIDYGSFTGQDKVLQACEYNMDPQVTPIFTANWMHEAGGNAPFEMELKCRRLLIITKDSADVMDGIADIYVDGKLVKSVNPRDIGWAHCNPQIILHGDEPGLHKVSVKMHEGDEDKHFTILGFGVVE